jgi:putative transposase
MPHRQPDSDIRHGRSTVYNLHVHPVFVTKYRRPVFSNEMLASCEQLMRGVCNNLDAERREFNGQTDHVHQLMRYPPSVALSAVANPLKGVSSRRLRQQYPTHIRKYLRANTSGHRPTSPPRAQAHHCRLSSNTSNNRTGPTRTARSAGRQTESAPSRP